MCATSADATASAVSRISDTIWSLLKPRKQFYHHTVTLKDGAGLTLGIATGTIRSVTLTLELSDLRSANERALAQLSRTTEQEFDAELAEIENFLLSIYRFAVLSVRGKQEIERAADVWRETLEVIDGAARQVQALSARHPGVHPSLDRILEIRHAASDMLALYA